MNGTVIIDTNLISYMDGKAGAEGLIQKALSDPSFLQSLSSAPAAAEAPAEAPAEEAPSDSPPEGEGGEG